MNIGECLKTRLGCRMLCSVKWGRVQAGLSLDFPKSLEADGGCFKCKSTVPVSSISLPRVTPPELS